jgi:hypothetical protein
MPLNIDSILGFEEDPPPGARRGEAKDPEKMSCIHAPPNPGNNVPQIYLLEEQKS